MDREIEVEMNELFAGLFSTHKLASVFLEERGLAPSERYRVGYCTTEFVEQEIKARPKFPNRAESEALASTGIYMKNENGSGWSRFNGRVMFPIRDLSGETVGFGARLWPKTDSTVAKYVNSQSSNIFRKAETLYGLYEHIDSIRHKRVAILVEGYIDVLAMVQMGFMNTIAVCGTNMSKFGAHMLRLLGVEAHVLMDGDEPGREASAKICATLTEHGVKHKSYGLPFGKDPADMISYKEEVWNLLCQN